MNPSRRRDRVVVDVSSPKLDMAVGNRGLDSRSAQGSNLRSEKKHRALQHHDARKGTRKERVDECAELDCAAVKEEKEVGKLYSLCLLSFK